jgi:hypothetical protein
MIPVRWTLHGRPVVTRYPERATSFGFSRVCIGTVNIVCSVDAAAQ